MWWNSSLNYAAVHLYRERMLYILQQLYVQGHHKCSMCSWKKLHHFLFVKQFDFCVHRACFAANQVVLHVACLWSGDTHFDWHVRALASAPHPRFEEPDWLLVFEQWQRKSIWRERCHVMSLSIFNVALSSWHDQNVCVPVSQE